MESIASPTQGANSPSVNHAPGMAQPFERLSPVLVKALSDTDLDAYINACAEQFFAEQRRWEQTGCFAAIGSRDGWWHAEAEALVERGCRPAVVARMEAERGLSARAVDVQEHQ